MSNDHEPGTVEARLTGLLDELHRVMPGVHNPFLSDCAEAKYIAYIENLIGAYARLAWEKRLLAEQVAALTERLALANDWQAGYDQCDADAEVEIARLHREITVLKELNV